MKTIRSSVAPSFTAPRPVRRPLLSAVAAASLLALGGCSTVEDTWESTWDAVFGEDASAVAEAPANEGDQTADAAEAAEPVASAPPAADGLRASPNRPSYDESASRREPVVRHALVDEPAEVQTAAAAPAPAPQRIERKPIPAGEQGMMAQATPRPDVTMSPASGEALAGSPAETMQPRTLAAPVQPAAPQVQMSAAPATDPGLLIAPTDAALAYGDDAAVNGLGTTVIGGDGDVSIEPYVPVEYVAGGGVRDGVYASEYDGPYAGQGLAPYGGGPLPMDAFNPAGAGVSTLVATIQFNHGSAGLSARDRKVLRQVVDLQKRYGGTLRVVGHASSRTANMTMAQHKMANFSTSAQRAERVASALSGMGVPSEQIFATAVSDNDPLYYEVMPSGEAGNRRAEIYLDY